MNLKEEVTYLIDQLWDFYRWNQRSMIPDSIPYLTALCISGHFEESQYSGYCPKAIWRYIQLNRDGTLMLHTYKVSHLYFWVSNPSQEEPTFQLDVMDSIHLGSIQDDDCVERLIEQLKDDSHERLDTFYQLSQWIYNPNVSISEAKQHELKSLLTFSDDVIQWIQTTSFIQTYEKTYLSSFYTSLIPFFALDNDISCLFECTDFVWCEEASAFYKTMRAQVPSDYDVAVGTSVSDGGVILCRGGYQTRFISR